MLTQKTSKMNNQKISEIKNGRSFFILILIITVLFVNILSFWVYINDDAYITFRYSKNLASGNGPVYNTGERVEGYTNFLWMLILSVFIFFIPAIDISLVSKILGTLSSAGTIFFMLAITREIEKLREKNSIVQDENTLNYFSYISVFFISANGCFALNSVSGLETAFFTMLVISGVYFDICQINKGEKNFGAVFYSLASLTRPEGFLIALSAFVLKHIILLLTKNIKASHILRDSLIYLIFLPYFYFKISFYGDIFPNTFYAKIGGFGSGLIYLLRFLYDYGYFIFFVFALIPAFILKKSFSGLYMFLILFSYLAGIAVWGGDWMEGYRLIVPVMPLGYLLLQEGIIWTYKNFSSGSEKFKKILVAVILFFAIKGMVESIPYHFRIYTMAAGYYNSHIKLAEWFRMNAKAGAKISLMDIGLIGYMNMDKEVIDITGLTDKTIARSKGNFLYKDYDLDYIFKKNPQYIVLVSREKVSVKNRQVLLLPDTFWNAIEQKIVFSEYFRKNYNFHLFLEHYYPHPTIKYYLNLFVRKG